MVSEGPNRLSSSAARHELYTEPIICIVGPTASGKSALAQQLALEVNGEVVGADSMQVYRGMDIGTGKLLPQERMVAHHCIDIANPGEPYSAALYQRDSRACFADIDARGKRALLCGGTGFYVRAAIDNYEFPSGEQVDNPLREECWEFAREHGNEALWQSLHNRDPESAELIAPNDVKRVIRAFELIQEGTSYARQKEGLASISQKYPAVFLGLKVDPDVLRERIDKRVDAMVEAGLLDEVKGLLEAGYRDGITSGQAIGYKEIVAHLDGSCSLDEALESVKLSTRRYAKRQRTWFRKDARIHWISADSLRIDDMMQEALQVLDKIGAIR